MMRTVLTLRALVDEVDVIATAAAGLLSNGGNTVSSGEVVVVKADCSNRCCSIKEI